MIITRLPDPPQAEIISMDDIKEFCRIDDDLDAVHLTTLATLRDAAIETGEQETGIIWRAASYEITLPFLYSPRCCIQVPISPVLGLTELVLTGEGIGEASPDPDGYAFYPSDMETGRPWATIMPTKAGWLQGAEKVRMRVTAGWTADTLPSALRLWALNRIASANDTRADTQPSTRETVISMPRDHSARLLDRYRVMGGPIRG